MIQSTGIFTFLLVTVLVAVCTPMVMGLWLQTWYDQRDRQALPESGYGKRVLKFDGVRKRCEQLIIANLQIKMLNSNQVSCDVRACEE